MLIALQSLQSSYVLTYSFAIYFLKEKNREIPKIFLIEEFKIWNRFHQIFLNPNTSMWMFIKLEAIWLI